MQGRKGKIFIGYAVPADPFATIMVGRLPLLKGKADMAKNNHCPLCKTGYLVWFQNRNQKGPTSCGWQCSNRNIDQGTHCSFQKKMSDVIKERAMLLKMYDPHQYFLPEEDHAKIRQMLDEDEARSEK